VRAKNRDLQYVSLMEMGQSGLAHAADQFGVAHEGRTAHEVACDIVNTMYPEVHGDGQPVASDVVSGPDKFDDTMYAQAATAADRYRFRDVVGDPEGQNAWPVDVPERQAGVGYKAADGSVHFLDSEGSVMLSGWGPEKVRFLLVSLSDFFRVDYVKQFVLQLDEMLARGYSTEVDDLVAQVITEQGWNNERAADQSSTQEPLGVAAVDGLPTWAEASQATEYPVVGTGDVPTEILRTDEINQYRPEGY
jgi:hypothetical protein